MLETLDQVRIVMVNPLYAGNVGGALRAMKNMGLKNLVLVEPRQFPHPEAEWRAAGAKDLLSQVRIVDTIDEAVDDCHLVIGTSARGRRIPWPVLDPRRTVAQMLPSLARGDKIALLFGREDRGLTNDELQRCHLHVHIPSDEEYGVLNVAMAVQVLCYELRMGLLEQQPADPMDGWDQPLATSAQLEAMLEHMQQTAVDLEFLDPDVPRQMMTRFRRLFVRARPDEMEINLLRGFFGMTQKWIKLARKSGSGLGNG